MSFELTPDQIAQAKKILAIFQEKFPNAFFSDPEKMRPLKIGIRYDLYAIFAQEYPKKAINRVLRLYTKGDDYFKVLTLGSQRVDLDGNPCGEVTGEHMEIADDAKAKVKRRQLKKETASQAQKEKEEQLAREQEEKLQQERLLQEQKLQQEQLLREQQEAAQKQAEEANQAEKSSTARPKLGLKKKTATDKAGKPLITLRVEKITKETPTVRALKLPSRRGGEAGSIKLEILKKQAVAKDKQEEVPARPQRVSKKKLKQQQKEEELSKLPVGKMELKVKIQTLPDRVKQVKHGWQQFVVEEERYFVRITVRPRTWSKMLAAAEKFTLWVANITGRMGPRIRGNGFELLEPIVQIFESKKKPAQSPLQIDMVSPDSVSSSGISPEKSGTAEENS